MKVDEKSAVYSFGVVLLELLTGRKPVGDFGDDGLDIVQWTRMQTNNGSKEQVATILDERLQNDVPIKQAMQVFFVAMLCVQEHSVERPNHERSRSNAHASQATRHISNAVIVE